MNRYSINSYEQAIDFIRANGYLFDLGQIAQIAITQLFMAEREGSISITQDSWPIRGLELNEENKRRVFEDRDIHEDLA